MERLIVMNEFEKGLIQAMGTPQSFEQFGDSKTSFLVHFKDQELKVDQQCSCELCVSFMELYPKFLPGVIDELKADLENEISSIQSQLAIQITMRPPQITKKYGSVARSLVADAVMVANARSAASNMLAKMAASEPDATMEDALKVRDLIDKINPLVIPAIQAVVQKVYDEYKGRTTPQKVDSDDQIVEQVSYLRPARKDADGMEGVLYRCSWSSGYQDLVFASHKVAFSYAQTRKAKWLGPPESSDVI